MSKSILISIIIFFLAVTNVAAQDAFAPFEHTQHNYLVADHAGSNYQWDIYTQLNPLVAAIPGTTVITGNGNSQIAVQWDLAGEYYLLVTEIDATGCNNTKAIRISVLSNNSTFFFANSTSSACAQANNDFILPVTFNDGNGIPMATDHFPILVTFQINGVDQPTQSISFASQVLTVSGSSFTANPITDTPVTITLTGATDVSNLPVQPETVSGLNIHTRTIFRSLTAPTVSPLTTNNPLPTFTGSATVGPNETFAVTLQGFTYLPGDGNLSLSGSSWTLVLPAGRELTEGIYEVIATVSNASCSLSDLSSGELTVDFTPPAAPTVVSQITSDTTPVITGTATVEAGGNLTVTVNGFTYTLGDGNLNLAGTAWNLQIPGGREITDGTYPVTAVVTDAAGNSATDISDNELVIDATIPSEPTVVSQVTSDTTPIISGTVVVGNKETLTVNVNGITYTAGDGKLNLSGENWTLQIPAGSEIPEGTYSVTATLTSSSGLTSTDKTSNELVVDTTVPAVPTVISRITSDNTPIISGTAVVNAGETLTVSVNGITYTDGDGKLQLTGTDWSLQIPAGGEIPDGVYSVLAKVTDLAGNSSSDATSNELTIDTLAPSVPTVTGLITNDTTPLISGTATVLAGETLTVTVNGMTYTAGDGKLTLTGTNWTLQVPNGSELLDGIYSVTATLTDLAGNSSSDGTSNELEIHTAAPPVPTVVSQVTSDTTPLIFGTAGLAIGETLTVEVHGITYTSGDGKLTLIGYDWSLQLPAGSEIPEGIYSVTATVKDLAGNSSTDVTSNELVVDITPPALPVVNPLNTSDTTPLISGTATLGAGEILTVNVNGITYSVGDGYLILTGTNWTLQIPVGSEIGEGTWSVTARVTDQAGNFTVDATSNELTIDTTPPAVPTVISQITNDTTPIVAGTAVVLTGETFTVTVNLVTYTAGDGNLVLSGSSWTLQIPAGHTIPEGVYPVTARVTDAAGNTSTDATTNELTVDTTLPSIPTVIAQVTNNNTPVISGTAILASGDQLTVLVNGVLYTAGDGKLIVSGSNWSLQIPNGSEIPDGTWPVTATVTDLAGNASSDITSGELIIDTHAPEIPTVVNLITASHTPILTGTAVVGSGETLTVLVNGITYTAGDGKLIRSGTNWTLQIPAGNEIPDGIWPVTAKVTDVAGNFSVDATSNELTVDSTPPAIPVVISQATSDSTPVISGTAVAAGGETLTVNVNGITYTVGDGKLTVTGSNWSLQIPAGSEIADGTYSVTATLTDAAGNFSTDITSSELIVDTTAPMVPTVINQVISDSTPIISGTATVEVNETLTVLVNGVTYTVGDGNLILTGTNWSLQIPAGNVLPDGTYSVTATVASVSGLFSTDITSNELIVDTTAPAAPTVISQITKNTTPVISGTAVVGSGEILTVNVNGVTYTSGDGKLIVTGSAWSLHIPAGSEIADGTYSVEAKVTDAAGNSTTDITSNELVVDTKAPAIPTIVSQVTSDTTPVISGTATLLAGEILTVNVNGKTYISGDGVLILTGNIWHIQIPAGSEIPEGTYNLTAKVTDLAGNSSVDATTNELVVDTTHPAIPTVVSQITNDNTPVISGTALVAAGEMLTVTVHGVTYLAGDGQLVLTGTSWTLQIQGANAIPDGTWPVTATVTDLAGNSSVDPTTNELVVDTTAPTAPTVISQVTNDITPLISGTAVVNAGETFTVTVDGVIYTAGDGKLILTGTNWSLQIPTGRELTDGNYSVTANVTDLAGNSTSDHTSNELIIDTVAPAIPTVVSQTSGDTTPLITGTAPMLAGETLAVTVNGVTYLEGSGQLTVIGNNWSLQLPNGDALTDGVYQVVAKVTDPAGNSSTDLTSNELIIDTVAPVVPTVNQLLTNDNTPLITGTAALGAGEKLTVAVNGKSYSLGDGNLTLAAGNWSLQIPAGNEITDGTWEVTATITDAAGNSATDSSANELTIDATPPVIPTVLTQATNDTTPVISGTATVHPGETFTVSVNGVVYTLGDGILILTGSNWHIQIPAGSEIPDGVYSITAKVSDLAGNISLDATSEELTIDTVAPSVPTVISQTTNENTPIISGTVFLLSGEILTVTVNGITYVAGDGNLSVSGNSWSLQLPVGAALLDGIYQVKAIVTDLAGNSSTDLTSNELTIDTIAPSVPTVNSQITNDSTPIISGTAIVNTGEMLTVAVNGKTYTSGDGNLSLSGSNWSLQIPAGNEIPDGIYPVTARVTDLAGNSSEDSTSDELTIDTVAPVIPTVNSQVTNDSSPVISGTATIGTGEVLTVAVNGKTYTAGDGNLSVDGTNWSLQIPAGSEIPDGTYSVTARVTDLAGNSSEDKTSGELIIDTLPPATPTVTALITNDTTPVIKGTAVVGSGEKLTVLVNGINYTVGDGNLSLSGTNWSLQIPNGNAMPDGTYSVLATVTDLAGNTAVDATENELVIDTVPPATPTVSSLTTNDTTPIVTGKATLSVGEILTVTVNGKTYTVGDGNLTTFGNNWILQIPFSNGIPQGTHSVVARVTDAAGNSATDVTNNELIIDTTPPAVPTVNKLITNNTLPTITGTATIKPDEFLTVNVNGRTYTPGDGNLILTGNIWSLKIQAGFEINEGTYSVIAEARDVAGNSSTDNTSNELVIDLTPPATPTVNSLITNDTTPILSGTANVGTDEILKVTVNAKTYTAGDGNLLWSGGNWTLQIPAGNQILEGVYAVTATLTDPAGNFATDVTSNELTIDTTPPATPTVISQITNDSTPIIIGTATIGTNENLTVTLNGITYTLGDGNLILSGNNWSLQIPTSDPIPDGAYSIEVVVTDLAGNFAVDKTSNELTIDSAPPAIPTVNKRITNDNTPLITGTAILGTNEKLTATVNGIIYSAGDGKLIVSGNNWSLQIPNGSEIPDGTWSVTATVTDLAGNNSVDLTSDELIIDTVSPLAPTVLTQLTSDHTPIISGTAILGTSEVLTVLVNGITYSGGDGNLILSGNEWNLQIPAGSEIPDGKYSVTAMITDAAGNKSTDPTANELTVDATPPMPLPTVTPLTVTTNTPSITGTAAVGTDEILTVVVNGIKYTAGDGNLVLSMLNWTLQIPAANAISVGVYPVTATVTDAAGNMSTDATTNELTIKVKVITTDRFATNDVNITFKNTPVSGNVLINDAGFYAFNPTIAVDYEPVNGTLNLNPDGKYTYTPKVDFSGIDNFYYTVCTPEDPTDCDTVNVTVRIINDQLSLIPPVAIDDEMQTMMNTVASGNVLANDLSVTGEKLMLNLKQKEGPKSGTLVLESDGTFVYTPKNGFTGQDYFVYELCGQVSGNCTTARVTITVSADLLEARLFAADDVFFSYGKFIQGDMVANDSYPSANTLKVTRTPIIQATHGTVSINANGTFSYTPTAGFVGTDQFVYEICDPQLPDCDYATVFIAVKAPPTLYADLAVVKTGPATATPEETISYQVSVTNLGTATASSVQISDFLPKSIESARFQIAGIPAFMDWTGNYDLAQLEVGKTFVLNISGTVALNSTDTLKNMAIVSSLTWDPNTANNVSIVNTLVRRGPVARILGAPYLAVGECDVDGQILDAGTSRGTGLVFNWSPSIYLDDATSSKPVFHPGKTIRYKLTVTDISGLTDTTSILVIVPAAPKITVERNVFVSTPNASILLDGRASTGSGLSYLWLSHDGIILNGETTPTAQVSGLGMYYIQVTDSLGCQAKDSVNVGLYIQAINDTAATKINESVTINVLKNDIPQNSINPSSISILTAPLHGIAQVAADSLIIYLPDEYYIGQDEFIYQVCDYFKNCDQAKVLVLINDVPFFIPEAFSPNGDGINDKFEIKGLAKYNTVEIEIFNRWGNIVYQSKRYGNMPGMEGFWDGTVRSGVRIGSGPVPSGTYFYILKLNGKENISGSIYLDR